MRFLAAATACSLRGFNVRRVDRDRIGRSGRVGYTLAHHSDHSRLGTISYPRYQQVSVVLI